MDLKSDPQCRADMTLPSTGGSTTLSVTGDAWWWDGDRMSLILRDTMRCSGLTRFRLRVELGKCRLSMIGGIFRKTYWGWVRKYSKDWLLTPLKF
jgi:hypothetical protein